MTEIKLTKRYPQSRAEDITDAFMRGYEQGKKDGLKVGKQIVLGAFETYITADRKTESSSEKPNNCEHITEDGVTCAKYPACDDCLDNPLNKVKGSERLLKGKGEPIDKDINVPCKTEPQKKSLEQFRVGLEYHTDTAHFGKVKGESITTNKVKDEPQTEREGE